MAIAKVFSVKALAGAASASTDTTNSTLLVAVVNAYSGGADPELTDNKSNTWTKLASTAQTSSSTKLVIFYAVPASGSYVGTGHTFTASAGTYRSVAVSGWSGTNSVPADQQTGATTASGTSLSTGSVTPSEDNELVIAGWAASAGATSTLAINASLSIDESVYGDGATYFGLGSAHIIQTTAGAVNPAWSWTGTADAGAAIATFKAAATSAVAGFDAPFPFLLGLMGGTTYSPPSSSRCDLLLLGVG